VRLIELASDVTLEELQEKTEANFKVAPALQAS
jgi:acyl CoA:acetate/3-ketoacid CoA transferase beta subunit